jgi:CBS domain-containing protein/biotin operon repressor
VVQIELKERQREILEIIKSDQPITGDQIAKRLSVTRSALRTDLSVLSMSGLISAKPKIGYFVNDEQETQADSDTLNHRWLEPVGSLKSMPIVIDEKTSVYDTIVTLFLEDVGTIFVTTNGCLSGVVSRKDLLKTTMGGSDVNKIPVAMIMTRMPNIVYVRAEDTLLYAAKKIIEHQIDCLPVVEPISNHGDGCFKVVGKVSKTNITNQFVEIWSKVQGGR